MDTITLIFKGYWIESKKALIPNKSGIYCVYTYKRHNGHDMINRLLYIGESENVNSRIENHDKLPEWLAALEPGEQLCYSFAPIQTDRERAEAALIFEHQPPFNKEHTKHFIYKDTEIYTGGRSSNLHSYFILFEGEEK